MKQTESKAHFTILQHNQVRILTGVQGLLTYGNL